MTTATPYEYILYKKSDGLAVVTINRPEVLNAFNRETVMELLAAFAEAEGDREVGAVILTGAGTRAFCSGGDVSRRTRPAEDRPAGSVLGALVKFHEAIRNIPKPVIAAVNGYAIGGGNVLQVLCDLSIASRTARFGQVGPRIGSFDAGFGSAYLARLVGERKAREIWFLCRQYTADEALAMGLVNAVVEPSELMPEAERWGREILQKSPTALKMLKSSFAADTDHIIGIDRMAMASLALYQGTPEAAEARAATGEKRAPDFRPFRSGN